MSDGEGPSPLPDAAFRRERSGCMSYEKLALRARKTYTGALPARPSARIEDIRIFSRTPSRADSFTDGNATCFGSWIETGACVSTANLSHRQHGREKSVVNGNQT